MRGIIIFRRNNVSGSEWHFARTLPRGDLDRSQREREVDALRAASKTFADKLATFEAKFPDAHLGAVVAFGNNTWRALSGGVGAEELKDFPGYGKGLAPTTQFDVLIHILSLRHDVNFSVARRRWKPLVTALK